MAPVVVKFEAFIGGAWTDITAYTLSRDDLEITRGRPDETATVDPSSCRFTLNNRDGRFSPRNPTSPYYGQIGRNTPLRVTVGGSVRFSGEVPAWPQQWDTTGRDVWVPVEAAGIMRRLGQGSKALKSALTRYVPLQPTVRAYWPMEDLGGSRSFASGLSGGRPMLAAARGLAFASQDGPPGSDTLPTWQQNGSAYGFVPSTSAPWRVDWVFLMPDAPASGGREMIAIFTSSDAAYRWFMACSSTDLWIECENDTGTSVHTSSTVTIPADFYGSWWRCFLSVRQSGASVAYIGGVTGMDGTVAASWAATVAGTRSAGKPQRVGLFITSTDERSIGHITVGTDNSGATLDPYDTAYNGFSGETAGDRFTRLCGEEAVTSAIVGSAADTARMGPQRPGILLELLQECADADQGILYEPRDTLGLTLRTRTSLYSQAATLALIYTAGVFGSVPGPVDDDQAVRNDVTATRQDGSSYRATLDTGALSTQAPPAGVGVYDEQITVNVENDSDLSQVAGWRLHLGTIDEARYPQLDLSLVSPGFALSPVLTAAAADLDIGDRLTISNLPAWIPPGLVTQLAQGFTEAITDGGYARHIFVNCTPESPYQVMMWESAISATGWKWDTAGSELAAGITSTATSLSVATTSGPVWTDDNAEDGFDIMVGGERMTVTDVSGTTSPQTFTVTRSVNGVVKAHLIGADVQLWKTPVWAR
jgi:hypothetical protein